MNAKRIFVMACLLGSAVGAKAQTAYETCSIVYSYDVAGNRIKREYKCESSRGFDDPTRDDPTIFTRVFPNPTTGVFTAEFSEPLSEATFIISAMNGMVVLEHELTQTASSITFDISAQVPGNYLLHVWALGREESYMISKIQ